jgi:hypothetical protein
VTRYRSGPAVIAVLLALSATPGRAADDPPAAVAGLRDQLAITLPEGWVVWDESEVVSGKPGPVGMVVFSAEPVIREATAPPNEARDSRAYRGEIPMFFLERAPARKGMSCEKLSRFAILEVGSLAKRDPSVDTIGQRISGKIAPDHTDIVLGGCRGVRFVVEVHKKDPAKHRIVDERVVSDGKFLYLFWLRNDGSHYVKNVEIFDRVLASVRLTLAK